MNSDQVEVLVILLGMSAVLIAAFVIAGLLSYLYFWLKGKK